MTESYTIGHCAFCDGPIGRDERVYHEVLGWEEERRQGGTNALRLRSRTGALAHWLCVDKAVGGHAGQLDLISAVRMSSETTDTLGVPTERSSR